MRTRTYGGVGGREGNNPDYPIIDDLLTDINENGRKLPTPGRFQLLA
jgi:hypothetical protein